MRIVRAAAVVLVIAAAALIVRNQSGAVDAAGSSEPPAVTISASTPTTAVAQRELAVAGMPWLVLNADAWTADHYSDTTTLRERVAGVVVLRPGDQRLDGPTIQIVLYAERRSWSGGSYATTWPLEGRQITNVDLTTPVSGSLIAVDFESGPFVLIEAVHVDRQDVIDLAESVSVDGGMIGFATPDGFVEVGLDPAADSPSREREVVYSGPNEQRVEVRVWEGSDSDIERQMMNRAGEAIDLRESTVGGFPVVVARQHDHRVFVVGGRNGFVMEIDLNPFYGTDAELDQLLSTLIEADRDLFASHLPDGSVIDANPTFEWLGDVPVPSGFDTSSLRVSGDRYQAGVGAINPVVCEWLTRWVDAVDIGDTDAAARAVDALASSRGWPALIYLAESGGYSEVVWEYADAIAGDGTVAQGRILTVQESYSDALGCQQ